MNDQHKPQYRFRLTNRVIGWIEVTGAVLLVLTGYSIGENSTVAIVIAAAYAACKNIVERAKPTDPIIDDTNSTNHTA